MPQGSYIVEIAIDPGKKGSTNLGRFDGPAIPPGSSVLFPSQPLEWTPAPGRHEVRFYIRPRRGRGRELYTQKFFTILKVPTLLSISPTDISVQKALRDEPAQVKAVIHNIGTRRSPEGTWEVRKAGATSHIAWGKLPAIAAGSMATVQAQIQTSLLKEGINRLELMTFGEKETPPARATFQIEVLKRLPIYEISRNEMESLLEIARARKNAWEESYEIYRSFRQSLDMQRGIEEFRQELAGYEERAINLLLDEIRGSPISWLSMGASDILSLKKIWDFSQEFLGDVDDFIDDTNFRRYWVASDPDEFFQYKYGQRSLPDMVDEDFIGVFDVLSYHTRLVEAEIDLLEKLLSDRGDWSSGQSLQGNYDKQAGLAAAMPLALEETYLAMLRYGAGQKVSRLQIAAYNTYLRLKLQFQVDADLVQRIRFNYF